MINLSNWIENVSEIIVSRKSNYICVQKQLLDTRFEVFFNNQHYANIFQNNVSSHHHEQHKRTVQIFCVDAQSLGFELPVWPNQFYERKIVQNQFSDAGYRGHYIHEPRTWQFYSNKQNFGIQLIASENRFVPWETGAPLRNFIHWCISNQHHQLCHSATLGFEGKAVILGGAGGSGKSGTTLSGIINGLSSVGDDYVLIENTHNVSAYPLFNILKQDDLGVRRICPQKLPEFGTLNWQQKYEIHFSQLSHCNFADQLVIKAILIPRIANLSKSHISPIKQAYAMRALAPSSTFQLPDGEIESIGFIASLCRKLPCFEIALSNDPKEISNNIKSFLAEHINE